MVTNTQQQKQATSVESEQRRGLKIAQVNNQKIQKEQYIQNLTKNIKDSKYKTPKTQAQQKQALTKRQKLQAKLSKMRNKKGKKRLLIRKYERIIKKYQRTTWMLLYVAAFADAFFDILTIPVISTAASFMLSLYINVVLWNVGAKKDKTKRRVIRASASILDLIPIINLIPISVLIVYNTQEREKRRVRRAKKALKKLQKLK